MCEHNCSQRTGGTPQHALEAAHRFSVLPHDAATQPTLGEALGYLTSLQEQVSDPDVSERLAQLALSVADVVDEVRQRGHVDAPLSNHVRGALISDLRDLGVYEAFASLWWEDMGRMPDLVPGSPS